MFYLISRQRFITPTINKVVSDVAKLLAESLGRPKLFDLHVFRSVGDYDGLAESPPLIKKCVVSGMHGILQP